MPRKPPKLEPIGPTPAALSPEELCADGVLQVKAAAAFAGLGQSSMKELIRDRELPSFMVKGRRVVPKRALVL